MGLAALEVFADVLVHRRSLFEQYERELANILGLNLAGARREDRTHAALDVHGLSGAP
jgi:hypothetical protein